jgi:hypothetical protein
MNTLTRILICNLALSTAVLASGGSTKQNPTPANAAEVHIPSESVPPGGTLQVKFLLTEPRPVTSTGSSFYLGDNSINGVSVWSSTGVAGGVAVVRNQYLYFQAIDPTGVLGMGTDYPFLTFTSNVAASASPGSHSTLAWSSDASLIGPNGPFLLTSKPGTLTVGGSVNIRGVYPGGGTWPAGTVIKVLGLGFSSQTRIQTPVKYSSISITPQEIDLTLNEQTTLDSQSFQVVNPDGSSDTYYSYLRGAPIHPPSRSFLQTVEPAFPLKTGAVATIGPLPAFAASQYCALALQNPTGGPLVVTLQLSSQPGQSSMVVLPSTTRVVDELSVLLNGLVPQPGDTLRITATSPVQILGILVDEQTGTALPVLPQF